MSPANTAGVALATLRSPRFLPGWRTPPLAIRNVIHGGRRSLAAISGVAFSLTMVLLQLGFLEAVKITATNNFEQLDFDIALLSPHYEQFYAPGVIPLARLTETRSVPGVTSVAPLYATFRLWRCPEYPIRDGQPRPDLEAEAERGNEGAGEPSPGALSRWLLGAEVPRPLQRRELFVVGVDPDRNPFREPIRGSIAAEQPRLRMPGRILLNNQSHPDFGWQLRDRVHDWELGGRSVTIVGGFSMLRGFAADSTVICTDRNFADLCGVPLDRISLGLVKVQPGAGDRVKKALESLLPDDVEALGREQILARETDHWVNQTSTGQLFAFGVLVAMIVATVVVYQVLSNDVREHLPEYATLKAMGYSLARLSRVVVEQSLIYMVIAYAIAVALAIAVYRATQELAGIPMRLTLQNLATTLLLAIAVGFLSGFLSLSRLRAAEPAELF